MTLKTQNLLWTTYLVEPRHLTTLSNTLPVNWMFAYHKTCPYHPRRASSVPIPNRIDFFGHDICDNGHRSAMYKHALMEHWPTFVTARDVASFIGFLVFYSIIPCFEQCIASLCILTKLGMETVITNLLTPEHEA